jgi:SAM-dependent methyltransferase
MHLTYQITMTNSLTSSGVMIQSWEDAVAWLVDQGNCQDFVRECYFDRPVIDAVRRYEVSEEWKEITKWLPSKPGIALDVGAGNGLVSYALAKVGWKVIALEPDGSRFVGAEAIRSIAAIESLPIDVVQEWGERMTFPDEHFDLVMARQVVHHARDLDGMYAEMGRVLKPNGTLLAFRDHVIDSPEGLQEFLCNHPLHHLYGGENAFTLKQYRSAIEKCGLRIQRQWNHFDSVINYAPLTRETLASKLSSKLPWGVLRGPIESILCSRFAFQMMLRMASVVNRKQGRAVSFLIRK